MDITPFDFSYLSSLLGQAYKGLDKPERSCASWAACCIQCMECGRRVRRRGLSQSNYSDINVRSTVLECAEKGQTLTRRGISAHGEYLLIAEPLFQEFIKICLLFCCSGL